MGYYTDYEVKITGADNVNHMMKILKDLDIYGEQHFSDDGKEAQVSMRDVKWYDWKEDCIRVSLQYPSIQIDIYGEGEESLDIWKARIRKGQAEIVEAKIVFDDYKILT